MARQSKDKILKLKYSKIEKDIRNKFVSGRTIAWLSQKFELTTKEVIKLTKDL